MSAPPTEPTAPTEEAETDQLWSWSAAEQDPDWSVPIREDRYARGATLAQSQMARVQLAQDPLLRRQVVLKSVHTPADGPAARRLLREARITAALAGPGVVRVLDAGVGDDGDTWFAMPTLEGETLAARHAAGAAGHTLLPHLESAARILARAHAAGIVHRDIKLDNMMIDADGGVTLLDWGIARPEAATADWDALLSAADQTAAGQVVGTPATMAPEQVIGAAVDRRADVWALGVCLAELATGAAPFARATPAQTMRAVVHAPPPRIEGPIGAVVAGCLQRNPAARLPDAGAFADALADALRPPAPPPSPAPSRTPRALLAGVGGLGVGVLVGALTPSDGAPPPPTGSAQVDVRDAVLVEAATRAAREGDRATADLLAAAGLREADHPTLRGILAATPLPLEPRSSTPTPECARLWLSPDGKWMVCSRGAETVVHDLLTGEERWRKPLGFSLLGFAGDHLVGWTRDDRGSRTFHLPTGEGRSARVVFARAAKPVPSPDATVVAAIYDRTLLVTDLKSGERGEIPGPIDTALVLPGGQVVTLDIDRLSRWGLDGAPTAPALDRHPAEDGDRAWTVAHSADGRWLVSGSLAGTVREWDLDEGGMRPIDLGAGAVHDLTISPDGTWIAAVDEESRAWLWPRGAAAVRIRIPGRATHVALPADDTLVTIGDTRTVWKLPDPRHLGQLGMSSGVSNVDWRGAWAAAALGDGSVARWQPGARGPESTPLVEGNVAKDVAVGPDGAVLAGSSMPEHPSRWLWTDEPPPFRECRRVLWLEGDLGVCQPVGPGPAVTRLGGASGEDLVRAVPVLVDTEAVPGRQRAVLIDGDGEVWQLTPGTPTTFTSLRETRGPGAVALDTADTLYIGRGREVDVHRADGTDAILPAPDRILDLAVSPAGDLLAAGLLDGSVAVWTTHDGALVGRLIGHRERVSSVAFDDGGGRLLTGSWDESVRTWELSALRAPASRLADQAEHRWGATASDALAW